VDVRVGTADHDVAWARALRVRRLADNSAAAVELAAVAAPGPEMSPPLGPDHGRRSQTPDRGYRAFHSHGAELRYLSGDFGRRGPSTVWVRLAVPVVPGEEPSPLQRVAAASDFGNGVSSVLDYERFIFINPDLSVHLDRPAVGEWVCLDARTTLGTAGIGMAQSAIWDVNGPIGRSIQSLLIEPRS